MAATVIIDRHLKPNRARDVLDLLYKLRIGALRQRGYQKGETLVDEADPNHWLVIATWASPDDWKSWQNNPERQALEAKLAEFLQQPPRMTVLRDVWA